MYKVLVSFASPLGSYSPGDVIDVIPDGADWLKAGFVEEVKEDKPAPKPRKRTVKKKS